MPSYAFSCMMWANFLILRFCHERGKIKRWGAVRHVIVSGISMRVFFICIFSQKKQFPDVWTFHVSFTCFFNVFLEKMV